MTVEELLAEAVRQCRLHRLDEALMPGISYGSSNAASAAGRANRLTLSQDIGRGLSCMASRDQLLEARDTATQRWLSDSSEGGPDRDRDGEQDILRVLHWAADYAFSDLASDILRAAAKATGEAEIVLTTLRSHGIGAAETRRSKAVAQLLAFPPEVLGPARDKVPRPVMRWISHLEANETLARAILTDALGLRRRAR